MIAINHLNPYRGFKLGGAWHLDYYISSEHSTIGTTSHSIIQFKNNQPSDVRIWCERASEGLSKIGISVDTIVRALGSKEYAPSGTKGLDRLGKTLANTLKCGYLPNVLSKNKLTPPMHTLKKPERQAALHGVYQADAKRFDLTGENILIIDDVTTGGVTLAEILRCMREEWPDSRYYFFALAKTNNSNTIEVVL